VFPWIAFGVAAIVLLVIGFGVMRSTKRAEHPAGETAADRAELEREFEAAERYQDQWRKEHHKDLEDERIP
jgi:hypothetical protein